MLHLSERVSYLQAHHGHNIEQASKPSLPARYSMYFCHTSAPTRGVGYSSTTAPGMRQPEAYVDMVKSQDRRQWEDDEAVLEAQQTWVSICTYLSLAGLLAGLPSHLLQSHLLSHDLPLADKYQDVHPCQIYQKTAFSPAAPSHIISELMQVNACETSEETQTVKQHPLLDRVRQCSAVPDQVAAFFCKILYPDVRTRSEALHDLWCADTVNRMFAETGTSYVAAAAAA